MPATIELDPGEKLRRSAPLRVETYKIIQKIASLQRRTAAAQMGLFIEESTNRWVDEHGLPTEGEHDLPIFDAETAVEATLRRSVPIRKRTYEVIKVIAPSQHRTAEGQMGVFLERSTARWIAEHGNPLAGEGGGQR